MFVRLVLVRQFLVFKICINTPFLAQVGRTRAGVGVYAPKCMRAYALKRRCVYVCATTYAWVPACMCAYVCVYMRGWVRPCRLVCVRVRGRVSIGGGKHTDTLPVLKNEFEIWPRKKFGKVYFAFFVWGLSYFSYIFVGVNDGGVLCFWKVRCLRLEQKNDGHLSNETLNWDVKCWSHQFFEMVNYNWEG